MSSQPIVKMRKNPTQARAAATIEAIVEAAAQILQKEGEDALTTAKIAERAGVSIGSLYQYFPNRETILLALIRQEREAIAADVARRIAGMEPTNGEAMVRGVMATLVAAFRPRRKRRKLVALMASLSVDRDNSGLELRDRIGDLIVSASRQYPEMAARPLTPAAAYVLTRAVLGAIRSAIVENSKILDDPQFEEELCRLAIAYLKG
ncbi:MAG: TetR/AcrR family transcriptional regulator [Pseudomonadota bacterium]